VTSLAAHCVYVLCYVSVHYSTVPVNAAGQAVYVNTYTNKLVLANKMDQS